jgi:hypothetical protein
MRRANSAQRRRAAALYHRFLRVPAGPLQLPSTSRAACAPFLQCNDPVTVINVYLKLLMSICLTLKTEFEPDL